MSNVWIIGSGGHCRPVIDAIRCAQIHEVVGILDINKKTPIRETILGIRVYGYNELKEHLHVTRDAVLAIGSSSIRRRVAHDLELQGFRMHSVIHPGANISDSSSIGNGTFIAYGANIGPLVQVGKGCIINTMANLEHEVSVGSYSSLGPGATVCGRSIVGKNTVIGASVTIIDNIQIADDCVLGAGSVIIRDVNVPKSTLVGVPGRVI